MSARWVPRLVLGVSLVVASAVSVPAATGGADPAAGLERFYRQALQWGSCADAILDQAGAQCANVLVPLDYDRPDGRTLTIAISRIGATDPARRRGVLLTNPGGPGASGLRMIVSTSKTLSDTVRAEYDLIGMDPRGIGRSGRIDCAVTVPTILFSAGFDTFGYARDTALAGALATACVAPDSEKARHLTTRNAARDMDVIRNVLGEKEINYFGASYDTYLGAVYTQMFAGHSGRMVFDSAIDPDKYYVEQYQDMGPINEYALDDWAAWAARHDADYHFGGSAPEVRAFVEDMIRRSAGHPLASTSFLVDEHTIPMMLLALLADPQWNARLAEVVRMISDGVNGLPIDLNALQAKVIAAVPIEAGGMAAVMCGDKAAPRDPAWYYPNIERARATQPVFGAFANNITACAFWPDPIEPPTEVRNDVPALILAATHDTRTAYQEGVALHADLPASRLITLADTRIHGAFRPALSPCLDDIVNAYLADGTLPATDVTCRPDPAFFPD